MGWTEIAGQDIEGQEKSQSASELSDFALRCPVLLIPSSQIMTGE